MKHIPMLVIAVLAISNLYAQDNKESIFKETIKNLDFKVIETFDNRLKASEPATLSVTFPDTGKVTTIIHGALGITYATSRADYSISGEWHRNTQIDEKQNVWQSGLNINWLVGDLNSGKWSLDMASNLKYSKDIIDKEKSLIATTYFSPVFGSDSKKFFKWLLPDDVVPAFRVDSNVAKIFQYTYAVTGGFEYEQVYSEQSDSTNGANVYSLFRLGGHIYPLSGFFYKWFEKEQLLDLYVDYSIRTDLKSNSNVLDRYRPLLKLGAGISLKNKFKNKQTEIKLAYEYTKGENPLKGLRDQNFQQVVLKFKM